MEYSLEKKEFPKSEVFSLSTSIDYSEGAIVSKIILRNDKGNLTLFAFDRGEQLSEHTAPFDAMVQVLDGSAEIRIADKAYLLASGETIIMPANVPHALQAVTRFKMLLTMIKG